MAHQDSKQKDKNPEFPSREKLAVYGDFMFLALRSPYHAPMPLGGMRDVFEIPIQLGHFRVFRFDDVPRALITWAKLDHDAEQKYLRGDVLAASDWTSGNRLWLMDFIAPYKGLTRGISRWIMTPGNLTTDAYYFRRSHKDGSTRKIMRVDLRTPDDKSHIFTEAQIIAGAHR